MSISFSRNYKNVFRNKDETVNNYTETRFINYYDLRNHDHT